MKIRPVRAISKSPLAKKRESNPASKNTADKSYVMDDIPGILGIPEDQVTPQVKDALIKFALEIDQLQTEKERLERQKREFEIMADEDPLVPVLNRRAFVRELGRTIAYKARYHTSACLAFFDIDDFKQINDRFGHNVGDMVLHHISHLLIENVRESDIVGRLGGDEFGVVLMQTTATNAYAKTMQLIELIADTPVPGLERAFSLSLSAGVCAIEGDDDVPAVMARADRLMYAQKAQNMGRSVKRESMR